MRSELSPAKEAGYQSRPRADAYTLSALGHPQVRCVRLEFHYGRCARLCLLNLRERAGLHEHDPHPPRPCRG